MVTNYSEFFVRHIGHLHKEIPKLVQVDFCLQRIDAAEDTFFRKLDLNASG